MAGLATDRHVPMAAQALVQVHLLGSFGISVGAKSAGPWPRLSAKKVTELVLLSPRRRIARELASDTLFPDLAPRAATNAMYNALSAARAVLAELGGPAVGVLRTDRTHIYVPADAPVAVDLEVYQCALRAALQKPPGDDRDAALVDVLSEERLLLEDETYSDWALRPRENLELARQAARLALARDRSAGFGQPGPEAVVSAWESYIAHDPASEEAAAALMSTYAVLGQRHLAARAYRRCCDGLKEIGLEPSASLEHAYQAASRETWDLGSARPADLQPRFSPLEPGPPVPQNLPEVPTSFVGRGEQLAALIELVAVSRLVTVTGFGGAGKSRLCLELAARLAPNFGAGAQLTDLSSLVGPSLVEVRIASLYGVRHTGSTDLLQAVGRELAGQPALLVLDNCEHVLDGAAVAVKRLLAAAPGLRVLATSREPLGVEGEQLWSLTPLAVPSPVASMEEIGHNESVRLFADRARLAQPTFTLDEQNASAVAAICRHLEGLPLEIELTAARVATMSTSAIATQLVHLTQLAATQPQHAKRHRSLDATIDWSYQLLNGEERRLLRTLSLFAGGFTRGAVEAVSGTERPLDGLASLVNNSLVVYTAQSERYHLLEAVRSFARARLQQAGENNEVALRHLRWCAGLAEPVWESAPTSREEQLFAAVELEIDNIRAAANWAAQHGAPEGLTVIGRLLQYWFHLAPVEGGSWAERMLGAIPATDPVATGTVLAVQSACAVATGDIPVALAASTSALAILREAGNPSALLYGMMARAIATTRSRHQTNEAELRALHLKVSELAARTGHPTIELAALCNLSEIERHWGNLQASLDYAARGMDMLRRGDFAASGQALMRIHLGKSRLLAGAPVAEVHPVFVEAFTWAARERSPKIVAYSLDCLAQTVAASDPCSGARLLGAAAAVRRTHGVCLHEPEQAEQDVVRWAIEKAIGRERTSEMVGSVEGFSLEQALQLARSITDAD